MIILVSVPSKGTVVSISCVQLFATPWTVDCQAPLSMRSFRQEYWSGLPFPSSGDLPQPWIKPGSPALQVVSLLSESPGKPIYLYIILFPEGKGTI